MTPHDQPAIWDRECRIYGRYILGQEPTEYLRQKYVDFHARQEGERVRSRLDGLLLRVARTGVWGTHLADAYATQFLGNATLRRKLVLVLALMECAPPSCEVIDRTFRGSRPAIALRMGWYGVATGVMIVAAVILLGPASLFFRITGGGQHEEKALVTNSSAQRESH